MSKREKSTQRKSQETDASRRKFLGAAAAAGVGAAALAAPNVARAQDPVVMKWQSTWPAKDIFHEYALDFAAKVNAMSGGRLKIEVLPAGAVVKAFDLLDAVSSGTLDGGHGVIAYWYGKNSALALWGSGPAFGMDPNMLLSWHYYGGGRELQRWRNGHRDVLAQRRRRHEQEHHAGPEDDAERDRPRHSAVDHERVCEERVEAHARRHAVGQLRVDAHQQRHREAHQHGGGQRAGERHAGAGRRQDRGIDDDDVGHRQEGG